MNEQFTVTDLHYVFGIDALESSRPIDFQVNTPDEINQMFDAISYEKGTKILGIQPCCSIHQLDYSNIRQLHHPHVCQFLGRTCF